MRNRRGSTYWTKTMSGHLKSFQKGDVVTSVIVAQSSFVGIVRNVCKKTNKVMVAWGGGSLVQHDPEEIQLALNQNEIVKSRMASRRSILAKSEDEAEADPQFVGDPKLHGLDKPRGGGFSIMQNLQKDLVKEEDAERKQDTLHPKVAGRKVKYRDYVIEKSGENFYVKSPSGSRAFGETPANVATAKKWIDQEIAEKSKKKSSTLRSLRDRKAGNPPEEHQFTEEDNPNPEGNDRDGDGKKNEEKPFEASALKSRRAMYYCGPDRTYRLTQCEQEAGEATCPKCKAPMEKHKFIRGNDILMCGDCGFKVTKNKVVTERPEPAVQAVPSPEAVVAEVTTTEFRSRRDIAKGRWPLANSKKQNKR